MREAALLWPWPWWTAPVAAAALIGAAWIAAGVLAGRRRARLEALCEALGAVGVVNDGSGFSVPGDRNALFVCGTQFSIADLRDARIVQTADLPQVAGLKIYEDGSDRIPFRLLTAGGAQSRKVNTWSIVDFVRLFNLMSQAGKRIEYIQE
jgi:hypothetical protein